MPTMVKQVPYVNLAGQHRPLKGELLEAIGHVFDRGQFILGDEVEILEQRFAQMCGVRFAVAVNSGTDGLILALRALNISQGDEVITVPNSFIASASCISHVGACPVFVDVRDDFNIDPDKIESAITDRTKAILLVHLTGRPVDMEPVMAIARRHHLRVVEDCAQAVTAEYNRQRVGSFGEIGVFSLHPLKTLNACGDGGILTTNDQSLCEQLKLLRNHGLQNRDNCVAFGINSRLDTIQAAILLVKLNYVDSWTERRRANAAFYRAQLKDVPGLLVPTDRDGERAVYHTFIIQTSRRDELKQYLADNGIETAIHYPIPIHLQDAGACLGYPSGSFPMVEQQAKEILSLPVFPELTSSDLSYVASHIRTFFGV